jgi:hypothetical protein
MSFPSHNPPVIASVVKQSIPIVIPGAIPGIYINKGVDSKHPSSLKLRKDKYDLE